MTTTHCFIPILGKRIRVTKVTNCGATLPATTADSWLATDGFITVKLSSQVESGAEIIVKKADGSLCVNEKLADSFKRFDVEIEFCGVNPSLLGMITNAEAYNDYNDEIAGFTVPEGSVDKQFALELWTGLSGVACAAGADQAGGYLLLPFLQAGVLGDIDITGDKEATFSMKGAYTKGGNEWGDGPYDVVYDDNNVAAVLPTALDPFDHLLLMDTGLAPPPSACDPAAMPPVNAATATAGTPGTYGPYGYVAPSTFAQANTWGVVASPATAWATGQYVQGTTSGEPGKMNWTGSTWATGAHA